MLRLVLTAEIVAGERAVPVSGSVPVTATRRRRPAFASPEPKQRATWLAECHGTQPRGYVRRRMARPARPPANARSTSVAGSGTAVIVTNLCVPLAGR
jgi:hypothetical protein